MLDILGVMGKTCHLESGAERLGMSQSRVGMSQSRVVEVFLGYSTLGI